MTEISMSPLASSPPASDSHAQPPVYSPMLSYESYDTEYERPSCFNICAQIRTAKALAKSRRDFGKRTISILCGPCATTVCLGVSVILPIGMLIIGILYNGHCTIQPMIPLWLIIMGSGYVFAVLVKYATNIISYVRFNRTGETTEPTVLSCLSVIIGLFLTIWYILGNIWIYTPYEKVSYDISNPNSTDSSAINPNYCHKVCYQFAFWSLTVSWIVIFISCFCMCGTIILILTICKTR